MFCPTLTKTATMAALTGILVTGTVMIEPVKAHVGACVSQLRTVDQSMETIKLPTNKQVKVTALRESAINRNDKGDTKGCLRDVALIKLLLKL